MVGNNENWWFVLSILMFLSLQKQDIKVFFLKSYFKVHLITIGTERGCQVRMILKLCIINSGVYNIRPGLLHLQFHIMYSCMLCR